jgi:hypothetical protein
MKYNTKKGVNILARKLTSIKVEHLYLAEKAHCSTLVTYDQDFRRLEGLVDNVFLLWGSG